MCPGSRNAPLIIGFSENPYFKVYSIVDERSAAFFALGIAQQMGHPVAVICTSGSAVLNFYPAVAEAYYSDIPLLLISADRPEKYLEIGDGQTIKQKNIFENHILYSANLKIEQHEQQYNETQINIAINTAIELNGPAHINVPFEEPLYQTVSDYSIRSQHVPARKSNEVTIENMLDFQKIWNSSPKKIILVGVLSPNSLENSILTKLASADNVLVFTETTSNLHNDSFFESIDQMIAPLSNKNLKLLQPDLLITIGGMVVSKKIKQFLRTYRPQHHWHIHPKKAYDTYFCLTQHIKMKPQSFFNDFFKLVEIEKSDYKKYWGQIKKERVKKHDSYINTIDFSDLKAFKILFETLPQHLVLQLSNSATVRYAQLFKHDPTREIYCNRGTSGIEGSTSTAVGHAVVSNKQVVLITGDLSFLYDINGLWNAYIPSSLRIIIINNQGGGIFRILQGEKDTDNFEKYIETVHQIKIKSAADLYGFEHKKVANENELRNQLKTFFKKSSKPKMLEIITPRVLNDQILLNYFKYLEE